MGPITVPTTILGPNTLTLTDGTTSCQIASAAGVTNLCNANLTVDTSGNEAANSLATHIVKSGTSSNTDITGRISLSSGAATYTLAGTYASAPDCHADDVTTPGFGVSVSESTTTITFTGAGSDIIKYSCLGRN